MVTDVMEAGAGLGAVMNLKLIDEDDEGVKRDVTCSLIA